MKHKLYAFWKHDVPPYVLGGEVTEIKSNGRVCVKIKTAALIARLLFFLNYFSILSAGTFFILIQTIF